MTTTVTLTIGGTEYFSGPGENPCTVGGQGWRFVLTDHRGVPLRRRWSDCMAPGGTRESAVLFKERMGAERLAATLTLAGLKAMVFDKRPEEAQ